MRLTLKDSKAPLRLIEVDHGKHSELRPNLLQSLYDSLTKYETEEDLIWSDFIDKLEEG